MMDGTNNSAKAIQVGIDGTPSKSQISLDANLFASGKISSLFNVTGDGAYSPTGTEDAALAKLAKDCAGTSTGTGAKTPTDMLGTLDRVISKISDRITTLGAAQNRIESAIESIGVQSENITSSLSTLRDADVATESSNYIKAQILQQASATLLATANQSPSIALNLL